MGTLRSVGELVGKLNEGAAVFSPEATAKRLTKLGVGAKADAAEAVSSILGDLSMSHWRRGNPIQIVTRFDVVGETVKLKPAGRATGPFRVLEDGRRGGSAHDLVLVGKVRKDGTRRGKSRGHNQGATKGKHGWTKATTLVAQRSPKRMETLVSADFKKVFS